MPSDATGEVLSLAKFSLIGKLLSHWQSSLTGKVLSLAKFCHWQSSFTGKVLSHWQNSLIGKVLSLCPIAFVVINIHYNDKVGRTSLSLALGNMVVARQILLVFSLSYLPCSVQFVSKNYCHAKNRSFYDLLMPLICA